MEAVLQIGKTIDRVRGIVAEVGDMGGHISSRDKLNLQEVMLGELLCGAALIGIPRSSTSERTFQ